MKKSRFLGLFLALLMLAGSLGSVAGAVELPIVAEPVTFNALVMLNAGETAWDELAIPKLFEEMTNVRFNYNYAPNASSEEFVQKLNLAFMSGSYDDVIFSRGAVRAVDDEAFGKDGFLIDLKPLIEEWMPNTQKLFEDHPEAKAASTAGDGGIYGLPMFYESVGGNPLLAYMDPYWLEVTGRDDVPNTTDELMALLVDIKAVMDSGEYLNPNPEMYPLGYRTTTGENGFTAFILQSFTGTLINVGSPFAAPDNKTMTFMADQPGFREAFEFMREVHRKSLIDPEAYVMDGPTWTARMNNCNYAVFSNSPTGQNAELVRGGGMALRPLTSQFNDRQIMPYETTVVLNMMMITDLCEQPEVLAQWADLFFAIDNFKDTDVPTAMMAWLGVYGETWSYTDETEAYYSLAEKPGEPGTVMDWNYLYAHYTANWNGLPGYRSFPAIQLGSKLYEDKQRTTAENMYPYCTTDTQLHPRARMTVEETEAVATILTDLQLYLRESYVAFITDERSIEDEWDAFIAECYRIGAQQVVDVYQNVYDRWNAAMN